MFLYASLSLSFRIHANWPSRSVSNFFGLKVAASILSFLTPTDLHSYAFDCVTHHLFHPYGTNSLQSKEDAEVMRELTFDDSLQSRLPCRHCET